MSKADDLRANAAECERKADVAKDLEAQRFFREAAIEWRNLALRAERQERD
jgi:hypothetical protein